MGKPRRKLLVGYSDGTALSEFVRKRWGWDTLHAPMLGLKEFSILPESEWRPLVELVKGRGTGYPWHRRSLRFLGRSPGRVIEGELVGGNLSVWVSMIGTRFEPSVRGKILFLEDVGEALYRLDRMATQLAQSGGLSGVKALVLGTFEGCTDPVPPVMASPPANSGELKKILKEKRGDSFKPLRPRLKVMPTIEKLFQELGEAHGIPVAVGLPVGHGPGHPPLPLGAKYRLAPSGRFEMVDWKWRKGVSKRARG